MRGAMSTSVMPTDFKGILSSRNYLSYIFEQENLPRISRLVINLPVFNGLEVVDSIMKEPRLHGHPKMVLSTPSNQIAIYKSYENGANYFIVKPNSCGELKKIENGIVLKWRKPYPYNTK
jgi:PleD family two-component response regulator